MKKVILIYTGISLVVALFWYWILNLFHVPIIFVKCFSILVCGGCWIYLSMRWISERSTSTLDKK